MTTLKRIWASVMASHHSMAYEDVQALLLAAERGTIMPLPPPWEEADAMRRADAKRARKNARRLRGAA